MTQVEQRFLTRTGAAEYLGISVRLLTTLVSTGKLKGIRPSKRKIVFDVRALNEFMRSRS